MPGIAKQRSNEIQSAAAAIVARFGIEQINALADEARKPQLVALAKQLQVETGITWNTARQHIAKACRRARGKLVEETGWGGKRPGTGRKSEAVPKPIVKEVSNMNKLKFVVIFDNGGGATLQVGKRGFVHHYDDASQAARDVKVLMETGDTSDWDGNEPQMRMVYDSDQERNGGIRWHDQDNVKAIIKSGKLEQGDSGWGWRNAEQFYSSLGVEVAE